MMAKASRSLKDRIAQRALAVEGSPTKVLVEVGRPFADDRCHTCLMQITSGRHRIRHEIHGIDDFQALDLALKTIGFELRHNSNLPIGRMFLEAPGDDMGFPEPNWLNYPGDPKQ